MKKLKKGNTVISLVIIVILCVSFISIMGTYVVSNITPYIWYEKLNYLALKYMFIIERYGYLTVDEKQRLINDAKLIGFDIEKMKIVAPDTSKEYGELIEFTITYDIEQRLPLMEKGKIDFRNKLVHIVIRKNSYSKI
ncbi:MAG: hypothetical protein N2749_05735 [Clostridia bacterium]|nr:hypothetical protein [Clostridia bacterium]